MTSLNGRFDALRREHQVAIEVHRGTGLGSIAENTLGAARAAFRQGADIVEVDVIASTDGDYFLFHNGYEPMAFGIEEDIASLSSAEIHELSYKWFSKRHYGVEKLDDLLIGLPDRFIHIDRSWHSWPGLLDHLEGHDPTRILLKSPCEEAHLARLAEHRTKFLFVPIVTSEAELELALAADDVNVVGVELIARDAADPFCDPALVADLQARGIAVFVNAIVLANRVPLFAGWDDEVSIFGDPADGWGRLRRLGADVIQTDWPGLLADYLEGRRSGR